MKFKGPRIVTGKFSGKKLNTANLDDVRPTTERVRSSLMDILAEDLKNCNFIDAYCGSGIVGLDALSRGAGQVIFVDKNRKTCAVLQENLKTLGIENSVEIICSKIEDIIASILSPLNSNTILFCDPPYNFAQNTCLFDVLNHEKYLGKVKQIIWEHHHKTVLNIQFSNLTCIRAERYGETQLSFLKNHG